MALIQRQNAGQWRLPTPEQLAALADASPTLRRVLIEQARLLAVGRISFADWQNAVQAELQRDGSGIDPALLAALGLAGAGALALTSQQQQRTPEQLLDALRERFLNRVLKLTEALASGQIDLDTWRAGFAAELDVYHPAAALIGANGSRDTRVLDLGRERALSERAYLNAWANELEANGLTSRRKLLSRARLYAGAAYGTASRAQAASLGITLPVFPGEGRCRSNCRCYWIITPEANGYRCTWVTRDDERTCPDCSLWGDLYSDLYIEARTA